jgi:uridine kinase
MNVFVEISNFIINLKCDHPIRVGIDGITASGKSTFAKSLVAELLKSKRPIKMTTLDGFHNPRIKRWEKGRESAEGYYYDAYNYKGVLENLLQPLGPTGNKMYKTEIFDLQNDLPISNSFEKATSDTILVVDGSFSLRNELRNEWDVSIYLQVDYAIAEDRASLRDAEMFSSSEIARKVTKFRYHGAHKIHEELAVPKKIATFVVLNNDPSSPIIVAKNF